MQERKLLPLPLHDFAQRLNFVFCAALAITTYLAYNCAYRLCERSCSGLCSAYCTYRFSCSLKPPLCSHTLPLNWAARLSSGPSYTARATLRPLQAAPLAASFSSGHCHHLLLVDFLTGFTLLQSTKLTGSSRRLSRISSENDLLIVPSVIYRALIPVTVPFMRHAPLGPSGILCTFSPTFGIQLLALNRYLLCRIAVQTGLYQVIIAFARPTLFSACFLVRASTETTVGSGSAARALLSSCQLQTYLGIYTTAAGAPLHKKRKSGESSSYREDSRSFHLLAYQ